MPDQVYRYLDANAGEPLRPEARDAVLAALEAAGNPASVHRAGRAASRLLEDARERLADRFSTRPADIVLTSGGTEADAAAVHAQRAGRTVIIGATEHDAIRACAPDAVVGADRDGVIDLAALAEALRSAEAAGRPGLLCLMLANNETGTIQPVAEAAALCRRFGAWLHVDAVQAAGRLEFSADGLGARSVAISSHKLGGPQGAGALLLASGHEVGPLIQGGGQERGRRGGTPSIACMAGFAAAAVAAGPVPGMAALRDAVEAAAVACGAEVCGAGAPRLPNTTCLALPGVRADAQVMTLDMDGFAVSAGAACSSGKVAASHVLAAMGLGALAGQAIRVSLPWNVQRKDVEAFAAAYARMAGRLAHSAGRRAA